MRPVLAVIYLVYNEGHVATSGEGLGRPDVSGEAIRLARLLANLMPDEPEVVGLLALLLLTEARRPARVTSDGDLVRLADQNRRLWDRTMIEEGQNLVRACLRRNQPGPYQVQAAIAAVHTDAVRAEDTDWDQIVALYDQLLVFAPTAIVALNRAIAVAETGNVAAALDQVERLDLAEYHLFHAARGDFLERLGRNQDAADAYARAGELTDNQTERDHLQRLEVRALQSAP
jgi:RNA polymerase sigma-70 factor (ECF subfamily)